MATPIIYKNEEFKKEVVSELNKIDDAGHMRVIKNIFFTQSNKYKAKLIIDCEVNEIGDAAIEIDFTYFPDAEEVAEHIQYWLEGQF